MEVATNDAVPPLAPANVETDNLRIDSTGWERVGEVGAIVFLRNPEGDVLEIFDSLTVPINILGEQLFLTEEAVLRETRKAGKTPLSSEDWRSLMKSHPEWLKISLPLAGTFDADAGALVRPGDSGSYWGVSASEGLPLCVHVTPEMAVPIWIERPKGMSVKCWKT